MTVVTHAQLARLKEEAARANSAYDAARKAYKAQQKAQARLARPQAGDSPLYAVLAG